MITKNENGTLHAVLGEGTLYTGVASHEGLPVGIVFTNNEDQSLDDKSVFIQMTTREALVSYMDLTMRYFTELIKASEQDTSELQSMQNGIDEFRLSIGHLMPKKKK